MIKNILQLENSSTNVHIVGEELLRAFYKLFCFSFVFQVISKKALYSKDFTNNLRVILYENNRNYNSNKLNCKFAFIPFLSIGRNPKQESKFQQVGGLVIRNISFFLFTTSRALLQRYTNIV